MRKRAGKMLSLIQGRDHDRCIPEVLQDSGRSSMYKVYDNISYAKRKENWDVASCLHYIAHVWLCSLWLFLVCIARFFPSGCLFFCRLKINHDSHEFILEFGTVANSMCRELDACWPVTCYCHECWPVARHCHACWPVTHHCYACWPVTCHYHACWPRQYPCCDESSRIFRDAADYHFTSFQKILS